MLINNIIGIIADDLTGANDTALQFYLRGYNTEIILNPEKLPKTVKNVDAWATSTDSRNISAEIAREKTIEACKLFRENFGVEFFYKKIDSTLRGNVAVEILAALEATEKDIAIICPAFIQEGRVTVGGYQLVKGISNITVERGYYYRVFAVHSVTEGSVTETTDSVTNPIDYR